MAEVTLPQPLRARLRTPAALQRGLIAGAVWGISLTLALTAIDAWQCGGVICIDAAVRLAGISVATGILAIGPIAAFGRCARA
jgi:hypothetical protein